MPVWSFSTQPAGIGKFTIEFWNPDMGTWSLPSEFNPGTGWMIDPYPRIRVKWLPASGYTFKNWSILGSVTTESSANPWVGTVTDPNGGSFSCWVTTPTQYTLTISVSPAGTGTTNPAPGTYQHPGGTSLSILATPASGYRFVRWDGDGSGLPTNPIPVTLWGNMNLIAIFEPVATTYFVAFHMDNARGLIYAAGVPRTDSDVALFTLGEAVTIQATAKSGYVFASWARSGGVSVANATQQTTTMTGSGDGTLTANFNPAPVYTPTISVSPTTIKTGTNFTVTGSGFNPALPVDIIITDLYHNGLQFPASQSPTPQGTLTLTLTLNAAITYSGTGYVVAEQSGGLIQSNWFQISISAAVLPQHRYYTRYVRVDSASDTPIVTFYVQDLTANTYLSQDTLTIGAIGKIICFKGSDTVYDSHHIRIRVKNSGSSTIGLRFGLAYNENYSNSSTNPALTAGSESAAVDIGTWSIFKSSDFDFSGCEEVGPPPSGINCEEKFPNRGLFSWDMIAYGMCLMGSAIQSGINTIAVAIGNMLKPIIDPFLQPFQDFVTTVTGIGTAVSLWIKDPWTELTKALTPVMAAIETPLKNYWNWVIEGNTAFFKPLTDALAAGGGGLVDWLTPFKEWLESAPEFFTGWIGWLTKPEEKIVETIDKFTAPGSPSGYETTLDRLLKTYFGVMGNPVGDFISEPGEHIRKQLELRIRKFQGDVMALADTHKDDPNAFTEAVIETGTTLDMEMYGWSIALELMSIGLVDAPAKLLEIVQSYSGPGAFSKLHMDEAIRNSIAIASRHYWANKFRMELPDTQEVINEVVKEVIPVDEFKRIMGLRGFAEEQAQRVWDAHFIAPARQELVTALRRGKITREAWERLKILVDLDPRYDHINVDTGEAGTGSFSIWNEMVYEDPGMYDIRYMFDQGAIDEDGVKELLRARGTRPEYVDEIAQYVANFQSRFFRRRNLTLNARLVKLDKISEDEFYTRAKDAGYTHTTAEWELKNQTLVEESDTQATDRGTTASTASAWYLADTIDGTTYRDLLASLDYSETYIDRALAYADKKKAPTEPPVTEREATRAMYDSYYMIGLMDAAAYTLALQGLRYPADVITLQLALLDKKKAPPPEDGDGELPAERELLQSEATAAFKKHIIDEVTYRDRLDKLGRSQDAIEVIVATAKADMASEQRDATLGVYSKAYRQGAILRSDYLAKLIDNQYMPDAAELIVQTEELSWGTGIEALTTEQTLNAWEQGFLTIEQTTDRLRKAGWTDADMKIRLSFSVIDMLKAKHLTIVEADKLWIDFGLGPEERARLAGWYGGTPA